MNDLVFVKGNDIFTDSLVIAKETCNEHHAIQSLIKTYENDFYDFRKLSFEMRPLESGHKAKIYLLEEPQATFLISLMRNNKIVVEFKKTLVKQFYQMRQLLLEKFTQQWIETRCQGKLTRRTETDTIQKLIEYVQEQGSTHAEKLYRVYSKLANKIVGIQSRDEASTLQLNNLLIIENIIFHVIEAGIKASKKYKEIYSDCKQRLENFKEIAYLAS